VATAVCLAQVDEIRRLDQERIAALREGKARDRFYTSDYLGFTRYGIAQDLKGTLGQAADPKFTASDVNVRIYGTGAVMTGIQHPGGIPDDVRFLRVWVREAGSWKIAAVHGTRVVVTATPTSPLSTVKELRAKAGTTRTEQERAVLEADQAFARADEQNQDARMRAMESSDYTFVSRSGAVSGLSTNDPAAAPTRSIVVAYDRVKAYGSIAVVQGTLLWTDIKGLSPGALRFTRVWVTQAGNWKLAAEQRTAIATP
jgi:hypothetical protein